MGTKKRERSRARARTKREEARRRAARRKAMTTGGLVVVILGVVAVVVFANRPGDDVPAGAPQGTQSFEITARNHVEGTVSYEQSPAGGDHNPVWQNCGSYSQPVVSENAVHSMEHGAVWITYSPDLPSDAVDHIREVAADDSFVLASPFPGLPAPVVATAWGRQLTLSDAADERLEQFVRAFSVGPQTPEPGAPCTGGTGEPE